MSKRRSHDDRRKLEPEDVLAGRVKVGAIELLDLIHRVNPTGRELHTREEELRYAQKSRLQSLLVRRFGPELTVEADPEREDTVSSSIAGTGGTGATRCWTRLLDEDARSWVQLQLDLGPPEEEAPRAAPAARPSARGLPPPSASADRDDASPESLVREAEEAVASYDYERARALLTRALASERGRAGARGGAPSRSSSTRWATTRGPSASGPPSRAPRWPIPTCGRCSRWRRRGPGDGEQALSLPAGSARGEGGGGAGGAGGPLALARGDAEGALAHLAEIRRRDPAHAALATLTDEIARLRAAGPWTGGGRDPGARRRGAGGGRRSGRPRRCSGAGRRARRRGG